MKKIIISLGALLILIIVALVVIFKDNNSDLKKIKVAEVAHSMFYAPQYAAIAEGYFEDEGLEIDLILTPGADKVAAAVLSGDVNIGFSGSEATIYVYNEGQKDYLVNFSALTKRDGSFIVSRKKIDNFTLEDMKGKSVIGGRKAGMPEMTFEWALREAGIDPNKDLDIDTSVAFPAMSGAFIGGTDDFVNLFEPQATQMENQGYGYVVESLGRIGGSVPYTVYYSKKSYIEKNEDIIKSFSKAIQKGLDFVHNSTPEEIAESIISFFPDSSKNDLISAIKRYKENDSWYKTTEIKEEDFDHIQNIIQAAGELDKKAPYDKLITTKYIVK